MGKQLDEAKKKLEILTKEMDAQIQLVNTLEHMERLSNTTKLIESCKDVHGQVIAGLLVEKVVRTCACLDFRSTGYVSSDGADAITDMILTHFGMELKYENCYS